MLKAKHDIAGRRSEMHSVMQNPVMIYVAVAILMGGLNILFMYSNAARD
ncbi:hypothetical protein GCM10007276_34650 [Agaricicola taiwanensis]|uniref:Uncharacterized protein n=1 Tax=Agaricicola taiwanensis TaxID=591372 RepID=A0A8J3DZB7_9RHOB|nr:hypothetical protein GCM10007276_34650 [Agaricicola taiwanensis]